MSYQVTLTWLDDTTYTTEMQDLSHVKSFCSDVVKNNPESVLGWKIYEIAREISVEEVLK